MLPVRASCTRCYPSSPQGRRACLTTISYVPHSHIGAGSMADHTIWQNGGHQAPRNEHGCRTLSMVISLQDRILKRRKEKTSTMPVTPYDVFTTARADRGQPSSTTWQICDRHTVPASLTLLFYHQIAQPQMKHDLLFSYCGRQR